jgi:hypothetical protein
MRRVERVGEGPIMPGGAPYMLVANLDESIANCLTWDLFRQGKLAHLLVASPSYLYIVRTSSKPPSV